MWNQKKYDIIVVGGGPAGSTFAQRVADSGLSVLLLDKKQKIGTPVRCGEAVAAEDLSGLYKPRKEWIRTEINTFIFVPPNKNEIVVHLNQTGYILDRSVFDLDLAKFAQNSGATIVNNAYVNGLLFENDVVSGVKGSWNGESFAVNAKLVIAADGVEGRIARFAGIKSRVSIKDLDSGFEKTLSDIKIDPHTCYFYLSNELAPGGYIWVFPKSSTEANIGIGITGKRYENNNSAKIRLDKFIRNNFPIHKIRYTTMGGIILAKPLKKMVTDGLMLIGDAARTVDPLSGGGIIWSMKSAVYASEVAIKLLKEKKEISELNLFEYQDMWMKNEGKQAKRLYGFKDAIYSFTDDQLNKIADKINRLPSDKITFANLFKISFQSKPSLLLDVAKQFVGL